MNEQSEQRYESKENVKYVNNQKAFDTLVNKGMNLLLVNSLLLVSLFHIF